jgi:hypothetical protein
MIMKLGEVIPKYREYRQVLVDQTRSLAKQRDEAQKKFELTGDKKFEEEAATLQLSVEASDEEFKKNQEVPEIGSQEAGMEAPAGESEG